MTDMKQHLKDRHMNPDRYTTYVDDEERVACWLLYNFSGQVVGYHQYRPDSDKAKRNDPKEGRYYTYVGGHKKERRLAVWGLETVTDRDNYLFVTEGVFDACRFHKYGYAAVAVMSNDPKHLAPQFRLFTNVTTVAVCDNDAAGKKLAKLCDESFTVPGNKDCGELTEREFLEFLEYMIEELE